MIPSPKKDLLRAATAAASLAILGLFAFAGPLAAAGEDGAKTYRFGTHPARTSISFVSEADLETIHGWTNALDGTIAWDETGKVARGRLSVPVAKMRTGIDLRDEHLRSDKWLDAAKHPNVELEVVRATPNAQGAAQGIFDYEAKLTVKGVTKDVKGQATVRFVPESVAGPAKLGPGDWVRVRLAFDVKVGEFGIQIPTDIGPKVSPVWKVSIDAYGTTAPPTAPAGGATR